VIRYSFLKPALFITCCIVVMHVAQAQKAVQQQFYYNAKGLTFVPPLSKPAIIYQGKLFAGKKQLTNLFAHLNNEELNTYFAKYRKNKTAANLFWLTGLGLSIYSLIDWRAGDKFNWYTFGAGLVCSGGSGYFNSRASLNLLNAAVVFDNATKKTTFVPSQPKISFSIPLTR